MTTIQTFTILCHGRVVRRIMMPLGTFCGIGAFAVIFLYLQTKQKSMLNEKCRKIQSKDKWFI